VLTEMSLEKLVLDKKEVPGMEFFYYLVELDFCDKLGKISSAKQSSIPKVRAAVRK
jgi:GT2 family glycosyltransferase